MRQPPHTINVGRATSGGIHNGIFGNPVRETVVTEQYRHHFRAQVASNPLFVQALREVWVALHKGYTLYCPGCGVGSPTCHARVIEVELTLLCELGLNKYREDLCVTK